MPIRNLGKEKGHREVAFFFFIAQGLAAPCQDNRMSEIRGALSIKLLLKRS
jgi:hypothetical protein